MAKKPTYIDLFAGCGGLSLGLHNAGWKGLFAVEKSPDAFKTLKHNLIDHKQHFEWPKWLNEPSNLEIDKLIKEHEKELKNLRGEVDLVAGGPPCQGFSVAGRRNENDLRNNLIDSYLKFIELVKPKLIFFENVKGFTMAFKKNRDTGKQYELHVRTELEKEYHVEGKLLNFGEYGVPQRRTRFILVGIRKDLVNTSKKMAESFFEQLVENKVKFLRSKNLTEQTSLGDAISDLLQKNGTERSPDTKNFEAGQYRATTNPYQLLMRQGCEKNIVVDSHRFVNHRPDIIAKFQKIINNCIPGKNITDSFREENNIKKHTIVLLNKKEKGPTITSLPDDYIHYCEPRVLTVREYARIQSFPDSYQFKGKYTSGGKLRIKEVPRYTQIGNAIPPLFGEQSGLVLKQLL